MKYIFKFIIIYYTRKKKNMNEYISKQEKNEDDRSMHYGRKDMG